MSAAQTVKLSSGHSMPVCGLGTWKSKPGEVAASVKHAIKSGYRHIDCAAVYGNETEVGEGISDAMKEAGVKREDLFITSKLWNSRHHPDEVEPACKKTLQDLGLDYLDLYLIHWPYGFERGDNNFPKNEDGTVRFDVDTHPSETFKAMEKLVEKGLVRSIGVSNFNSEQISDILEKCKIRPAANQVECHAYLNQAKLLKFCKDKDVVLTAYSPLGSPDRPWAAAGEASLLDDPKLVEMGKKYGKSAAQILLRWQIQRGVTVIPKSVTPSRIEENFKLFDFTISDDDVAVLDGFDRPDGRLIVPLLDGKPRDAGHPHYPFNIEF